MTQTTEYDTERSSANAAREHTGTGSVAYIALWTTLIMLGLVVEFLGRFFGYAGNPLAIFHPLIPALTGISAAFVVLAGYFTLVGKRAKRSVMTKRTGVLLVMLGAFMLAGFFVFRQVIPLVFG
ncbi:MAG: hypothetical protein LBO07_06525 [Coriobacteriales bacterium]|jgi:hypothetical protein|nr:hypothetical protein [Coriobacteriales bacterium]